MAAGIKCPYCRTMFHYGPKWQLFGKDGEGHYFVAAINCPACGKMVVEVLLASDTRMMGQLGLVPTVLKDRFVVVPRKTAPKVLPQEVPSPYRDDFDEAQLVLPISTKASAAIARRLLQHTLREMGGVKKSDLIKEIQEVMEPGKLPSPIQESLDAIRHVGNFAAHPIKSQHTGEIVDVEPGEAEWLLDLLEQIFDYYFVQPEKTKARKEALNKRLAAGKPTMK